MKSTLGDKPVKEMGFAGAAVSACSKPAAERHQEDPLRRFTPTLHTAALPVMGRTVLLETNSQRILKHLEKLFECYPGSPQGEPSFVWRIVSQNDVHTSPPWPQRNGFSDHGLRLAEFGQRNFLAVDIDGREAIAFVSEGLVEDAPGFTSPFLDTLFYMTAGSLGLISFTSACVALGTKGLLVLGPPNQGKTTASYLAAKSGLTYHADQATFLEIGSGVLRAWGDFVPVSFRPEALRFLPELELLTHRFSYCDFTFYYMDRQELNTAQAEVVVPVCCVFLERESASVPRLVPVPEAELSALLSENIAFKDDDRFEGQRMQVLEALARLPAYRLAYGSDPAIAVPFFHRLLTAHDGRDATKDAKQA